MNGPSRLARFDESLRRERAVDLIGGLDEAGRGALAGPVVAAVVVLGRGAELPGVNDSKQLRPAEREGMVPLILAAARAFGLGLATAPEIDRLNVLRATHLAAARALAEVETHPELLVTDYLHLRNVPAPMLALKKGDATSLAVAAASVLAKVARDRIMSMLDPAYPGYGFARHKGYGTARHLGELRDRGGSSAHRRTFAGVCWFDAEPGGSAPPDAPEPKPLTRAADGTTPIPWRELLDGRTEGISLRPFLG